MSDRRLAMLYHPSHHVPDLDRAEEFFERVFGRPSTPLSALARPGADGQPARAGSVPDHSIFTPIADVLFDSIDPRRYVVGGERRYPDVERPHLKGMGFYVADIHALYRSLRGAGVTVVDQLDRVADGDEPPNAVGSALPLCFTVPDDAGLRYELVPRFPFPLDPRLADGWKLPPPSADDPLGIVRCAHHTVLTVHPERALRLTLGAFGGTVVHRGRDDVLAATGTWVLLGDAIVEFAVPEPSSTVRDELASAYPGDAYHSIAWQVLDLGRVERHLRSVDVGVVVRTDDTIVVDPDSALGVPWRFTTTPVPGDPRP